MTNSKPKVLFIAPRFPYPLLRGDQLTVFKMCEYFRSYWDIDLLVFEQPEKEAYVSKIPVQHLYVLNNTLLDKAYSIVHFALGAPLQQHFFASALKQKAVNKHLSAGYDFIYVHTTRPLHLIPKSFRTKTCCGVQISIALQNHRHYLREKGWLKLFYKMEAPRYRHYEKTQLKDIPLSFVITEDDRKWLDLSAETTHLLPHGVDVEKHERTAPYNTDFQQSFHLIFSGNLDFGPNVLAMERLQGICDRLKQQIPHIQLWLVGKCNNANLMKKYNDLEGVTMTGFVDSFTPYFNQAAVMINPLTVGSGLQNKVIESLSYGVPVVCTPLANNGIKAPASCCIEAETDEAICSAVLDIYQNPEKAASMHRAAAEWVRTHFTWEYFLEEQRQIIEKHFLDQ
ncbi:MAG TPA: glycosyltransferase family 4 protein [Saprospiraceae bacterium]|nr:glycosyltransferase family 4 protein [Saprospiraceae bacterium]HMQ81460.1 glycosyltransferase family 4 protein [Saprospiraceae bacterium]